MAAVLVIGAGLNGLAAGGLLARDGHDVTVLEHDPAEPDRDAHQLWNHWERPGVNQFRQLHVMLGRRGCRMEEVLAVVDESPGCLAPWLRGGWPRR
jgi:2-polyprenyl-6-methoxyphenol hydroxylase-like FAD-dependent oxidoreductase